MSHDQWYDVSYVHPEIDKTEDISSPAAADRRLMDILAGIDETDDECVIGWWETTQGAAFGAEKLAQLRELIRELVDP